MDNTLIKPADKPTVSFVRGQSRPEGARTYQPRAAPWVMRKGHSWALKGRHRSLRGIMLCRPYRA